MQNKLTPSIPGEDTLPINILHVKLPLSPNAAAQIIKTGIKKNTKHFPLLTFQCHGESIYEINRRRSDLISLCCILPRGLPLYTCTSEEMIGLLFRAILLRDSDDEIASFDRRGLAYLCSYQVYPLCMRTLCMIHCLGFLETCWKITIQNARKQPKQPQSFDVYQGLLLPTFLWRALCLLISDGTRSFPSSNIKIGFQREFTQKCEHHDDSIILWQTLASGQNTILSKHHLISSLLSHFSQTGVRSQQAPSLCTYCECSINAKRVILGFAQPANSLLLMNSLGCTHSSEGQFRRKLFNASPRKCLPARNPLRVVYSISTTTAVIFSPG